MVVRRILFVLATVLLVVGVSQLFFSSWWLNVARGMVDSPSFYLYGMPAVLIGVIMLIAVLEPAIGLRAFFAILSLVTIAEGALLLANPNMVRDSVDAFLLSRSLGYQRVVMLLAGGLRILIGLALLYALVRPASARTEVAPGSSDPGTVGPADSYS